MDTDIFMFGADQYLTSIVIRSMRDELMFLASAASTEEDQQAFMKLAYCIEGEVVCNGMQIKASFGLNREGLSRDFLEKHSGKIDLVEMNAQKKIPLFLQVGVEDQIDPDKVAYYLEPEIMNQFQSVFGGG